MSAFPLEVVRSVTCVGSLSRGVGTFISVVTFPSQTPDRAFSLSKDFCASVCANAAGDITMNINIKRAAFIGKSPLVGQFVADVVLYITITLHHTQAFSASSGERAHS